MSSTFPSPVLAVAADVVRHLEGEEALPRLWTLFTKCKESLKDGRRLENISWRLWYRSMSEAGLASCDVPSIPTFTTKEALLSEKVYRPPTPEEIPQSPPITFDTTSNVPLSAQGASSLADSFPRLEQSTSALSLSPEPPLSPSLSRKLSSRRKSSRRASTPISVGKILCELLPTATVPSLSSLTPVPNVGTTLPALIFSPTQTGDPRMSPSISLPLSSRLSRLTDLPTMTAPTKEAAPLPSLPTPEAEHAQRDCSLVPELLAHSDTNNLPVIVPVIRTSDSSPFENSNQPPSGSHNHPETLPPPPRLVVVNPTPNLTPHPTPPATPVLPPPIASHMQGTVPTASEPLLRVPGQDVLVLAQACARSGKLGPNSRLLAHESGDEKEKEPNTDMHPACNPTIESNARSEEPSIVSSPTLEEPEFTVNPNRHSLSSDTTTSSSTASDDSKTTSATTISEPFHYAPDKRRVSPELSRPLATIVDTGLSPTSPPYVPESGSTQALVSPASKRRKDKDGASESPAGKASSTSSISKGPGSVASNKGSSSSRLANPVRKGSTGGGGRSRVVREASTTSVKSRSRSRTRENSGTGSTALVMTRASSGKGAGGKATRGRTGGARTARGKAVSRKQSLNEVKETAEELKRAMLFNIGSGSEEGSHTGSKGTGSGSELNLQGGGLPQPNHQRQVENGIGGSSKELEIPPLAPTAQVEEKTQSPRKNQSKGREREMVTFDDQEKVKGKGKERVKSPMAKHPAAPSCVEATIAEPLLPGSARRQIVITSDSEDFETETDSWSDAESADAPPSNAQHRPDPPPPQPPKQQQQQQTRPHLHPLTRTQSHYIPRNYKPFARAQQRLTEQRVAEDRKWKEEMFVKLPKSSFQDLAEAARTRSAGLLTQLLNPETQGLPTDHPYRRGFSSGMIQPLRAFTPLAPVQPHPQQPIRHQPLPPVADPPQLPPQPAPQPVAPQTDQSIRPGQHSRQASRTYQLPKRLAALAGSSVGAAAKTPAAIAVMSELRVGSVSGAKQVTTGGVSINGSAGKYKPKTRPPETVMEDTSDSEDDNDNQLDLSKSVAQEKLRALLEAKKSRKSGQATQQASHDQVDENGINEVYQGPSQPVEPISIPPPRLLYPYNLPPPNPPTTPRTTRRKMLAVEIPESLRRNLLWERQVSQAHPRGLKRSASSSDVKGWHIPNVVKLTPKGAKPDERKESKDEKRARWLARTRSFAFEYHAVGW